MIEKNSYDKYLNTNTNIIHTKTTTILKQDWQDLQLAYNNTFIGYKWKEAQRIVGYLSNEGQIIQIINLEKFHYELKIILFSQHEVLITTRNKVKFIIWNLKTKQIKQFTHKANVGDIQQYYLNLQDIFVFKQTNLLCLYYLNRNNCNKSQAYFCYFKLPLSNSQPYYQINFDFQYMKSNIMKVNQRSMIGILPTIFQTKCEYFQFTIVSINETNIKEQIKHLKMYHGLDYLNLHYLIGRISDIWEIHPNIIYLQYQTYININLCQHNQFKSIIGTSIADTEHYHNIYFDYNRNIIKHSKISYKYPHRLQFAHSIRSIKTIQKQHINLQQRINQSIDWHNRKKQASLIQIPIYFIQINQQQIITVLYNPNIKFSSNIRYVWPTYNTFQFLQQLTQYDYRKSTTLLKIYQLPTQWSIFIYGVKFVQIFILQQIMKWQCDQDLVYNIDQLLSKFEVIL